MPALALALALPLPLALAGAVLLLAACETPPDKRPVPYGTYLLRVVTAEQMAVTMNPARLGAAFPWRKPCEIWVRQQSELGRVRFDEVLRHEAAHCNGWTHGVRING